MGKIVSIKATNVKGQEIEEKLTGRDVWLGENGVGKSARLQAFMFGVQGFLPTPFKRPMSDTFQIASGDVMVVNLQTDNGFGFGRTIRQKKTKHQNGDVSFSYKGSASVFPDEGETTDKAREKRIAEAMGTFSIMFDLDEFMSRSDAKKRELVFALSSPESYGWDKDRVLTELANILGEDATIDWLGKASVAENIARLLGETHSKLSGAKAIKKNKDEVKAEIILIRQRMMDEAASSVTEIKEKLAGLRSRKSELDAEIAKGQEIKKQHSIFEIKKLRLEEKRFLLKTSVKPTDLKPLEEAVSGNKLSLENFEKGIEAEEVEIESLRRLVDAEKDKLQFARGELVTVDQRQHIRETIDAIDRRGCPLMGKECESDLTEYKAKLEAEWNKNDAAVNDKRIERDKIDAQVKSLVAAVDQKVNDRKKDNTLLKANRVEVRKREDELKKAQNLNARHESDLELLKTEEATVESFRASLGATVDVTMAEKAKAGVVDQITALEEEASKAQEVKNVMGNFDRANIAALEAEEEVNTLTALHDALGPKGVQAKILADVIGPLAKTVNDLLSKVPSIDGEAYSVEFNLHDLNGKEVFEIYWPKEAGVVHYNTLSGGQQILFGAALMVALIMQADPPHKSMCIEAAELSAGNFYNLLGALDLIATDIDNILVASCSDSVIHLHTTRIFPKDMENPFENWNVVHLA